ncbi:LysM peptidoglycan-binding domain-containing protein [Lacticaseibacillus zhaodongensis]|uniref:LysM peptidoglycan-binding domain-containing protein n=1 Tax=Lacticaseibacillus zhaodongensis TaxID=2668065 RepID=UPI0012D2B97A|nr:LysM peptidoglycan-binding domain-containing protein [Lacticaseibacillus zhaodongensis]
MPVINVVRSGQATRKVQPGDTLFSIAEAAGVSVGSIRKLNDLKSDELRVGKVIKLK